MGEARRARIAAAKTNLKLIRGGKEPLPVPEKIAPAKLTDLHILVPTDMAGHINDLHSYIGKRFPTRNDFLVELLASGLTVAATALQEALEAKKAREAPPSVEANLNHEEGKKPKFTKTFGNEAKLDPSQGSLRGVGEAVGSSPEDVTCSEETPDA